MNKDCFAREGVRCGVLKVSRCTDKPCSFYKTRTQLRIERQRCLKHLEGKGLFELIDYYNVSAE